jgi:hypothetical protein
MLSPQKRAKVELSVDRSGEVSARVALTVLATITRIGLSEFDEKRSKQLEESREASQFCRNTL